MQIGDQVRFLNETGGGKITGFQGKDIVLVEDQDGFDIPVLRSQVVVVETNANNFVVKKPQPAPSPRVRYLEDGADDDPSDRPMSYQAKVKERKGGDELNVFLAFVPVNSREFSRTAFEAYLVNDSNYFACVALAQAEGDQWRLRWQGIVEPNTKQLVETFEASALNEWECISAQVMTWKRDYAYPLLPLATAELRIDTVKFFKLHAFRPSPFFREPSLVYDIVRKAQQQEEATSEELPIMEDLNSVEEANSEAAPVQEPVPQRTREEEREALKAAKRALKEELRAQREKERAERAERDPHFSKPNHIPAKEEIIEVDLHINALLDHTEGLSPSVLLNTQLTEFRIMMDRNIKKKGQRIVFIHGKGEGVLRAALIKELQRRYRSCTYEDASFQKYGFGATMVTVR